MSGSLCSRTRSSPRAPSTGSPTTPTKSSSTARATGSASAPARTQLARPETPHDESAQQGAGEDDCDRSAKKRRAQSPSETFSRGGTTSRSSRQSKKKNQSDKEVPRDRHPVESPSPLHAMSQPASGPWVMLVRSPWVILVRSDNLVPQLLQAPRHPLALGRRLDQYPPLRPFPHHRCKPVPVRVDPPLLDDLPAPQNAQLTIHLVHVDAKYSPRGLLLLADLTARLDCGAFQLPRWSGGQPLDPIYPRKRLSASVCERR